jgi:hypothetical protein
LSADADHGFGQKTPVVKNGDNYTQRRLNHLRVYFQYTSKRRQRERSISGHYWAVAILFKVQKKRDKQS